MLAVLTVVAAVVPLLVAWAFGALGTPRTDGWSYLETLFHFAESGQIDLQDWTSMTLIGQILLATPIALVTDRNVVAIQMSTALIGFGGLAAVVGLARRIGASWWVGGFVAITVAVGPMWATLAASFMTDVPAFAAAMASLLVGIEGLRRRPASLLLVAAGLALGLLAFSIRQYAVIPAVVVGVLAIVMAAQAGDAARVRRLVVLGGVLVVAIVAVQLWWMAIPNDKALSPAVPGPGSIWDAALEAIKLLRVVGLLLVPVLVFAGPIRMFRRAWRASPTVAGFVATLTGLAEILTHLRAPEVPFLGGYFERTGIQAGVVLAGNRPDVVPWPVFELLVLVGSAAAVLLAVAAIPPMLELLARARARDLSVHDPAISAIGLAVAGYSAAYFLASAVGLPIFDRYALPLVPLVALLVLRGARADPPAELRRARTPTAAGVALGLLALVGLVYTIDAAAFDGTRRRVAELAVAAGYAPETVNGGFEWVNEHLSPGQVPVLGHGFPAGSGPCVVVVVNPTRAPEDRVVARRVSRLPWRPTETFVALATGRDCAIPAG